MDRSAHHGGAHRAPPAGLDPQQAISRALHLRSAAAHLTGPAARGHRRRGRRFYEHHGFDWHQIQIDAENDAEGGRTRGASTLTQQLVKNLFFGTGRSFLRKGAEASLVPVAEVVLGKQRILELYLNVVEWGPGIYGAEAASHAWYGIPARNVDREQAARLAAILPAPLRRRPERMNHYSALILERMRQVGW